MSILRVFLFGKFRLQLGKQVLTSLNSSKVQELFCYLLLYRDRPHPREALASLLWSDSPTVQSRKYLRQALWQLQAAMNAQVEHVNGRLLLLEDDWVRLNPKADLWLDVGVFERAFVLAQGVPGQALDDRRAQVLHTAVYFYHGDLLEGWYQDWCLYERERLRNMYLAMLDKLIGYCEAHHRYEAGLACCNRILRYDRAHERTHRQLMRMYYLAGDRTAALRQYERCAAALDEELGVRPASSTVALYQQIRADQIGGLVRAPVEANMALEATAATLPELLSRLKHLEAVLIDIQRQVQQEIHAVEMALSDQR